MCVTSNFLNVRPDASVNYTIKYKATSIYQNHVDKRGTGGDYHKTMFVQMGVIGKEG